MMPTMATAWERPGLWENRKITCVFVLATVFLAGAVAGALAMNLGADHILHKHAFWNPAGRDLALQRLEKELDLTPTQTDQLRTILDDFGKYYQGVLASGKNSIFAILDDRQKRKFEKLLIEARQNN